MNTQVRWDSMDIDQLCVNALRVLTIDAIERAKSGHPGMPLGAADMAYVLWTRFLKHNPRDPRWPNRDRFILSAGHGSMLLYALLHLTGYDLPLEELKRFRQWGSRTPGHPEYDPDLGVEMTTGPLGQGFATGVGMAIAERWLRHYFNRPGFPLVDHYVYAIVSDGDLMEGISHEAASFAGHQRLGRLIYLYDDNHISIDGPTSLAFTEDVAARFEAYGWHVQKVDGHDREAVAQAIARAREVQDKPSLIMARTHIGYGSPHKQDTAEVHGAPLGPEEARLTKERLGWPPDKEFFVPERVYEHMRQAITRGEAWEKEWQQMWEKYRATYPELAAQFEQFLKRELPPDWDADMPVFEPGQQLATRKASGKVLNAIAPRVLNLVSGSADLTPSNQTYLHGYGDLSPEQPTARNIHYGVREHAMAAAINGMVLHGGLIPYGGTFLVFSDYLRPSLRLAALMKIPSIFVFTHDSLWLGEDGPTHQPVEHIPSLRAMPNLTVIRPSDATEVVEAWRYILTHQDEGPMALLLTRQGVPVLDRSVLASAAGLHRGAYVLAEAEGGAPRLLLLATGSEVHLALGARDVLQQRGIPTRVVAMPSWEIFERQPQSYREEVLPPEVTARLAVEAAMPLGWERYVGTQGDVIGVEQFGASAPYKVLMEHFGFTVENIVARAEALLSRTE
ncbi:MAG: transketolase [Chloroflexi bacterium]|nr:transketolase [Chloroflexota bacterium]